MASSASQLHMDGKNLSVQGNQPSQMLKDDVPRLDAAALAKLDAQIELLGEPDLNAPQFDFPCNDSSYQVNDFREWSYFKREQFHVPPVNMKSSFLWNPDLLANIRNQKNYKQFVPEKKLTGYRETNQNLARKKRAKRMLAIWRKSSTLERSVPNATNSEDNSDARSDVNSKLGTSKASKKGSPSRAGSRRSNSRSESRGRSASPSKTGRESRGRSSSRK